MTIQHALPVTALVLACVLASECPAPADEACPPVAGTITV
jgi:hypothetical protein